MARAARFTIGLCLLLLGAAGGIARADPVDADSLARLRHAIAAEERQAGPASPRLLPLLKRLARLQFHDGDLPAATAAARRAVTVAIAAVGLGSPVTAAAMVDLANADLDRLDYLDAEPLLVVAGTILDTEPDADAAIRGRMLVGLARIARARGNPTLAETRARSALALAAGDPSAEAAALRALGAALAAEHKFAAGEPLLRQAVADSGAGAGDGSLDMARSLAQLGDLYLHANRFADALAPLEEAAAIDQSRLAPDHPFIADDFHDIGIADEGLRRYREARRVLAQAFRVLKQDSDTDGPRIAFVELELSHVERDEGDNTAADAAFRYARHILDRIADRDRRREARA